uniref:Uncharacterized protein n=1 Tax=Attheya septentrionalis TaxID=420275 RepID=A0A7S2XSN4_9STRA|mmetsp:Transcript_25861/g.46843  ORF Transcript_25861/g.46843 Transcript_25861/m.46843 type:complete len:882 (+) Transcript_25861:23-2668(+)
MASPSPPPPSLFDMIATKDYDGMVDIYAKTAKESIVSYISIRRGWVASKRRAGHSAEEKLDEYFHQQLQYAAETILPSSQLLAQRHRLRQDPLSFLRWDDIPAQLSEVEPPSLRLLVTELDDILKESVPSETHEDGASKEEVSLSSSSSRERSWINQPPSPSAIHPFKKTKKQAPDFDLKDIIDRDYKAASSLQVPSEDEGTNADDESELVSRDGVATLSNEPPVSSFYVYKDRDQIKVTTVVQEDMGAPLFDGSVAVATPPERLNTSGPSGGNGTALHLACALDAPFALAVLLVMGAAATSRHTAFRRLMIHEAACCGSQKCLKLCLELGEQFAMEAEDDAKIAMEQEEGEYVVANNMDDSSGISCKDESVSYKKVAVEVQVSDIDTGYSHGLLRRTSFATTLRLINDLTRKMKLGEIDELDAARSLIRMAEVPALTKAVLIRSCTFSTTGDISHWGFVDGHGNTPLHWASFKNAGECVSILLDYEADPDARAFESGWTPLHDAAYSDASDAVRLLLNARANVDATATSGATPLCFAAQEDSANAAKLLLDHGANPSVRCCGGPGANITTPYHHQRSRFSGYTPLHYCAHYNAHGAARVLLQHPSSIAALEVPDLVDRLPIHVAVARGSSDVLRELLRAGARIDANVEPSSPSDVPSLAQSTSSSLAISAPHTPVGVMSYSFLSPATETMRTISIPTIPLPPTDQPFNRSPASVQRLRMLSSTPPSPHRADAPPVVTPVSSPVLRSLIPHRPIKSSKPWNCLSQQSINECQRLLSVTEMSWAPDRHYLFTPNDRKAVMELLRVGKRLEQNGTGIFCDLWPLVLSFCGRGWFEPPIFGLEWSPTDASEEDDHEHNEERSLQMYSSAHSEESDEMTQFHLEG